MTVELSVWELVTYLFGSLITVVGAFWAVAKVMLRQNQDQIAEKFAAVSEHLSKQDAAARHTERAVQELRVELARDYVRREDYTIAISTVMNKIDALGLRMEDMFRGLMRRGSDPL